MGAAPRLEIQEEAGHRRITIAGDWRLYALLDPGDKTLERLETLTPRASDVWDFTGLGSLDSAGALVLWRSWGGKNPPAVEGLGAHERWFKRFSQLELERPPLAGRYAWFNWILPGLGKRIAGFVKDAVEIALMGAQFFVDLWHCVQNPRIFPLRELSATLYKAGAQSLFLVGFLGVMIGLVLTYQIGAQLMQFGLNQQVIGAIGLAFTRELGPFIAALVLVGRLGSATTAGIGAMRITEELDALRAFGVSPSLRVMMPRVLGMTIAMPLLVVWTDFWGIMGGVYLSGVQMGVTWQMWLKWFPGAVPLEDYFIGIGKGALFGFIIGIASAYYGLSAPPDTQGLTRHITRAVVVGLALVLVIESVFGFLFSNVGL